MAVTWTKDGTTITLTDNTLVSDLVSEQAIVAEDTISFSGFELVVDANASSTSVKLGGPGSLKIIDNGNLQTSTTIPSTIALSSDIKNATGPYTGNASGRLGCSAQGTIYSGMPHFRTVQRFPGNTPWKAVLKSRTWNSSDSTHTMKFNSDLGCIAGDILCGYRHPNYSVAYKFYRVVSYDSSTFTAVCTNYPTTNSGGNIDQEMYIFCVASAPLLIVANGYAGGTNAPIFAGGLDADEIMLITYNYSGSASANNSFASGCITAKKMCQAKSVTVTNHTNVCKAFSGNVAVNVDKFCSQSFSADQYCSGKIVINDLVMGWIARATTDMYSNGMCADVHIHNALLAGPATSPVLNVKIDNYSFNRTISTIANSVLPTSYYDNMGKITTYGGSVTPIYEKSNIQNCYFHSPSSIYSTSAKYTDQVIPPNKSLMLKVNRLVETDSISSTAFVAITDQANWYPQTKSGAYAELTIKDIPTDAWQTYTLKYRNTTNEPMQVRVWECVTGSIDGGYLKVENASGGSF